MFSFLTLERLNISLLFNRPQLFLYLPNRFGHLSIMLSSIWVLLLYITMLFLALSLYISDLQMLNFSLLLNRRYHLFVVPTKSQQSFLYYAAFNLGTLSAALVHYSSTFVHIYFSAAFLLWFIVTSIHSLLLHFSYLLWPFLFPNIQLRIQFMAWVQNSRMPSHLYPLCIWVPNGVYLQEVESLLLLFFLCDLTHPH